MLNLKLIQKFENKTYFTWGLGIGDWGLGIGDWAQSPIPNPQSPCPIPILLNNNKNKYLIKNNFIFLQNYNIKIITQFQIHMKFILISFYYVITCFGIIISNPIELSSYSEIELKKGTSEYFYSLPNLIYDNSNIPYIFIKLLDKEKINLKVYINGKEFYFSLPKGDEWINIPLTNEKNNTNILLKVNSQERNLKMIFIDSSKIISINLSNFLNLNLNTNKLYKKPFPLLFEIIVDKNIRRKKFSSYI